MIESKDNTILIIDGTNLIHRNYYAHSYRKTKSGIHTVGLYGTIRSIKSYINEFNPIQIFIAFDKSEYTFRNKIYSDYKQNRPEIDLELLNQFEMLREYSKLVNIAFIEKDLHEADDIIGSLSCHAKSYNLYPYVISGDRDILQLVDKGIDVVYLSNKGLVLYKDKEFIEEYNIKPNQYIDYKALVGDLSDNIPGVLGIGDKTAAKLLREYGSLEAIYENINNIRGKRKENLLENKENVFIFREILAIKTNMDLGYDKYFIKYINEGFNLDNEGAKDFLEELEISL